MINETTFATLLMLATMVMAGMEMPVKPYLDKAFALSDESAYPKYKLYRSYVLRAVAIGLSAFAVLATDGASIMAMFDKSPVGNVGNAIDLVVTAVVVSFGDQGLHNLYDFARLYMGRDAIDAKKVA